MRFDMHVDDAGLAGAHRRHAAGNGRSDVRHARHRADATAAVLVEVVQRMTMRPQVDRPAAQQSFGKGDVRGVIASESANNTKEGRASAVHGMIPGPDILTTHLNVTCSMVWSIALANIVGAGLCYLFSVKFALLATLRYTL